MKDENENNVFEYVEIEVIPREGVERKQHYDLLSDTGIIKALVIPREGVESGCGVPSVATSGFRVIPREGVERLVFHISRCESQL